MLSLQRKHKKIWTFSNLLLCFSVRFVNVLYTLFSWPRLHIELKPWTGWLFNVSLDSKKVSILIKAILPTLPMLYLPFNLRPKTIHSHFWSLCMSPQTRASAVGIFSFLFCCYETKSNRIKYFQISLFLNAMLTSLWKTPTWGQRSEVRGQQHSECPSLFSDTGESVQP